MSEHSILDHITEILDAFIIIVWCLIDFPIALLKFGWDCLEHAVGSKHEHPKE